MFSTKFWSQVLFTSFVGAAYVALSVALIMSNKWLLMDEGRFPHPEALGVLHLFGSAVFSWLLYLVRPTLFTEMPNLEVTRGLAWRFIPLSVAFAGSMIASNAALVFSPISVLQVMKQGNVVLIFMGSIAVGLEKFGKASAALVMLILCGVLTCILSGPATVGFVGVAFQLASQCCEVGKVLMQSVLMSSKGHRLDPLSMVLFLAPISAVIASAAFFGRHYSSLGLVYASILKVWPLLLVNSIAAFSINVVVAWTIWSFNPRGFLIAGIIKDIAIVLAASTVFGEQLNRLQCAGFSLALIGISLYGSYKIRKGAQSAPIAQSEGPQSRHVGLHGSKTEKQPLLKHEAP
jgi:hypothetical protein